METCHILHKARKLVIYFTRLERKLLIYNAGPKRLVNYVSQTGELVNYISESDWKIIPNISY